MRTGDEPRHESRPHRGRAHTAAEGARGPERSPRSHVRVTANLFGIPLGLAGLAQCWTVAHAAGVVPGWTVDVAWVVTAATWAVLLASYLTSTAIHHRLREEPSDPTYGPFTSAALLVPTMLSVPLTAHSPTAGRALFAASLLLGVGYGGWLTGQWITAGLRLDQLHPAYLLPTVATGLVSAAASADMGHDGLARLLFGYGALSWIALGPVLWARPFVAPPLPSGLVPTLAIHLAPPVVAGNAWFAINHHRADAVSVGLAGYAVLMALVQVRLIPVYARLRFGPSWWAFTFPCAAATAVAMRWVVAAHASHGSVWLTFLLVPITCGVTTLAVASSVAVAGGTFLPRDTASRSVSVSPPQHQAVE